MKYLNHSLILYWTTFIVGFLSILYYCNHYIEFTDLAFHLLHVSQTENINIAVSSYFLYLEPIYNILGGNVALYRQATVLILVLSVLPLLSVLKKYYFSTDNNFIFPIGLLATLTVYVHFVLTPNYNWFCYIGLILFAAGIFHLWAENKTKLSNPVLSGFFIGLSGWVCFISKPTTAVAIAFIFACLCLYIIIQDKDKIYLIFKLCLCAAVTLLGLVCFHFLFLDDFSDYKERVFNDVTLRGILDSDYSLQKQFISIFKDFKVIGFYTLKNSAIVLLFFLPFTVIKPIRKMIREHPIFFLRAAIVIIISILFLQDFFSDDYRKASVGAAYGIAFVSTVSIYFFLYFRDLKLKNEWFYSVSASFLLILTYCLKIGSNVNYVAFANMGGLFFLFTTLLYLKAFVPYDRYKIITQYFVIPLFTIIFIGSFIQNINYPYRSNSPIYKNAVPTQVSMNETDILNLDRETHFYITGLRDIFLQNGFEEETLLIDMTGATPLANYILNAKIPTFPWLIGGYDGSREAAIFNLSNFSNKHNLRKAWIIIPTTPTPRTIDPVVLKELDLNFPQDYTKISEINFPGRRDEIHSIWKPK